MLTPGTARPMPSTPASSRTDVDGGNRRSITATKPRLAIAARLTNTSRRSDQVPQTRAGQATGGCGSSSLELSTTEVGAGRETSSHSASVPSDPDATGGRHRDGPSSEAHDGKDQERHEDREQAECSLDLIGGEPLRLEARHPRRHVLDAAHEIEQGAVAELGGRFGEVVVERLRAGRSDATSRSPLRA